MARPKHQAKLKRRTHSIEEGQDQWLEEVAAKEHSNKNILVRLALDVLRWMYERDGRLPRAEDISGENR